MAFLRELLPISSWCDKWLQELFKIEYRFGYLVLTVYNDKSIMQNDKKSCHYSNESCQINNKSCHMEV